MPGVVSLRYLASLWRYPALPLSLHARRGIVAVFGFAVVVSCFALIYSPTEWYHCSIGLRCGGIQLCPYLFTPGMVLLQYLASLWHYPALHLSLTSSYRWWWQRRITEVEGEVCGEK